MTVPALMGLPSTTAFSGDQKSPGTPAHHLEAALGGREDSGGILPGPEGSGPSGRQETVLGPAGHRRPFSRRGGSSSVLAPG